MNARNGDGTAARFVFVSYSRTDQSYLDALEGHLKRQGITTWTDHGIDYGARWTMAIRDAIDDCAVFVVVMTPAAEESEWVDREIHRARTKSKPILPLLLSGDPFFVLGSTQYDDVSNQRMPTPRFLERLRHLTSTSEPGAPVDPQATATAWSDEGSRLLDLGRYEEAVVALDRAIQLDPSDASIHRHRGQALANRGLHEEALRDWDRAIELDPGAVLAHINRAGALRALGRNEEALNALDRAIQIAFEPDQRVADRKEPEPGPSSERSL
jgi:hypothetical protein